MVKKKHNCSTSGGRKFDSIAQTKKIISIIPFLHKVMGTKSKVWQFFILSIALSTWILGDAILLVSSNSLSLNFPDSFMNGGTFTSTPLNASIS